MKPWQILVIVVGMFLLLVFVVVGGVTAWAFHSGVVSVNLKPTRAAAVASAQPAAETTRATTASTATLAQETVAGEQPGTIACKYSSGFEAINQGDLEDLQRHFACGDINVASSDELGTPLHRAALNGELKIAEYLLDKGADINARGYKGETPLFSAIYHMKMVKFLLDKGADINARGDNGCTAIQQAACLGIDGTNKVALYLLDRGADTGTGGSHGMTLLHNAAQGGSVELVGRLLDKGLDPNALNDQSQTPLHIVGLSPNDEGRAAVAKLLVERGARMDIRDKWGRTPAEYTSHQDVRDMLASLSRG